MRFTVEDIRRQLESSAPGMNISQQADLGMQNLLSSMATAAQNSLLEGCPIFIDRLRAKLGQRRDLAATKGKNQRLSSLLAYESRA
jgi:hypothetical protein